MIAEDIWFIGISSIVIMFFAYKINTPPKQ